MARICEEPSTPSFGGGEDDPASDLLGGEGEKVLEAFLDSALENDSVLRGILEEGLTQIIKAAIRLLNLQRRRDRGQSQGHSREAKEKGSVPKSKVNNAMNSGDPQGQRGNRLVGEGQGTSQKGPDNNSPVVNSLSAEEKGALGESHHDLHLEQVGGKSGNQPENKLSQADDEGDVGEEFPISEGGLKKRESGVKMTPAGKRRKGTWKPCCYFCQKTFSAPSFLQLERHFSTHTQERPFPCTLCEKEFARKGHLDIHIRIHRKEKPFKCTFCGKDFTEKGTLNKHIRRHVKEKAYKCPHPGCTSSFTTWWEVKSHAKVHSGEKSFSCNLCGKGFSHRGSLDDHIRHHVKEKWFKCPHPGCTASFVAGSNLNRHSRVHSGEKPFACPFPSCGKTFSQKGNMSSHRKTHDRSPPI